ncbi:hypothetical protein GCM10022402_40720 [Salinactinospora qingdaonensis]|uniref:Uncharacterized protein n=1 Tax=Salinactinospora qingdaonensis TaxID=702744 RepID=A0ABP7G7K8_9ACTN
MLALARGTPPQAWGEDAAGRDLRGEGTPRGTVCARPDLVLYRRAFHYGGRSPENGGRPFFSICRR